jgi:hypothetical protein
MAKDISDQLLAKLEEEHASGRFTDAQFQSRLAELNDDIRRGRAVAYSPTERSLRWLGTALLIVIAVAVFIAMVVNSVTTPQFLFGLLITAGVLWAARGIRPRN